MAELLRTGVLVLRGSPQICGHSALAAQLLYRGGANYVQSDPPQLGNGHGTTTTATITGTAYRCASAY